MLVVLVQVAEIQFSKIDEKIPGTNEKCESFGKFFFRFDCNEKYIFTHDMDVQKSMNEESD